MNDFLNPEEVGSELGLLNLAQELEKFNKSSENYDSTLGIVSSDFKVASIYHSHYQRNVDVYGDEGESFQLHFNSKIYYSKLKPPSLVF